MRPQLLRDAYFVPLDNDGVYLRSSHRVVEIPDLPLFPWVERLAPYLTGEYTLDQLTGALPVDKRSVVEDLVRTLHEQGLVRDLVGDRPHTLSRAEQDAYEAEITYVETYTDSAEHRFQRYRETRVLLVGAGLTLEAGVHAALRSGIRDLDVLLTPETGTDTGRLAEILAAARERDPAQNLTVSAAAGDWTEAVRDAGAVLHLTDRTMLGRAAALDRACAAAGVPLLQAVVLPTEAWIGPIAHGTPLWTSAWRRLRLRGTDTAASPFLTGSVPAVLANHTVFRLFTHLTGSSEDDWTSHLFRVDLETLETSTHRFHPHPLAEADPPAESDDEFQARMAALRAGPERSDEDLSQAAVAYLDPRTGVFGAIDEESGVHLPLWISRVTVVEWGLVGYGASLDFASARYRAMRRAVELYASVTVDERRQVRGLALPGHDVTTVDAGRVFVPAAEARRQGPPPGVACAATWSAAVLAGLLGQCEDLAGRQLDRPCPRLSSSALTVDPSAAHLVELLGIAGADLAVYDTTGPLGVPTLTFCVGAATVTHACGLTGADALRAGLSRTVLWWQTRTDRPAGMLPAVPELPVRLRGEVGDLPARSIPADALAGLLVAAGHRPVVVPLDHDPQLAALAPYVVRVVLADD